MANIEMNVLKVGDSEFEIADAQARQDCSDLKDDFNQLNEFTFNPTIEPFHELNNASSFFTSKPGYYASTNGWSESSSYNSYYLNLPKGTKMYFKRTGVTNQFRLYIYKTDDISSGGHIAHYTSSDDIPVTELTAMTLGQDSTVVISLTATQDSSSSWSAFFNYFVLGEKLNLHSLVPSIQKLYGKTIYCFGDSITGMFSAPTDYPSHIAKLTGANCVNVGFSGTRMSTYQDLYVGMSMYNLASSIASGDWTVQQQTIDNNNKTEWQAKKDFLANTNWNNVDGITIFFGTNDYGNGAYVNDETGATESKSVGQSLNYAIKTILTAYPHLQILVVTPIWRAYSNDTEATQDSDVSPNTNGKYLIDYVDAEIEVANKNHIPVLDMYRNSQFSKYTNTLLLSDGTHPTETGLERIGNLIAEKLIECFL